MLDHGTLETGSVSSVEALRQRMRHSASHIMADAVLKLFPEAKMGIGPPTHDGFYYDFEVSRPFTPEDLEQIEALMHQTIDAGYPFRREEFNRQEAKSLFAHQPYKLEIIDGLPDEETLSVYRHSDFVDLCQGPHVEAAGDIPAVKLLHVAGAYWRGDERRPMLQRIYGTAFESQEALDDHLERLEEAKRRDHRKIGEDLQLFTFSPEVGRGLPLWLPNGTIIREELENWAKETERKWGYQRIATPHITRGELFRISGHLPYYKEDMYPPMDLEGEEYYLKPMNCPLHHMVYKSRPHSYRELPIRYAEYGTVYRYEKSGQLFGLMRPRGFTQNDAHIYCTFEQAEEEFLNVMRLHQYYYERLGITDYHMVLALPDLSDTEKYHGDEQLWRDAEQIIRRVMDESGIPYVEEIGGASHYGPKIDFIIRSVTGREFGISTNQLDLYMPKRFDLTYVDSSGKEQHVVVIHRAPLGSHERIVAFLIEHYGGAFPLWLAPVQAVVIPIADRHIEYAEVVRTRLVEEGFRVEVDGRSERMNLKIRNAQLMKVPYMLVVGDAEVQGDAVAVRHREDGDLGPMPLSSLMERLTGEMTKQVV